MKLSFDQPKAFQESGIYQSSVLPVKKLFELGTNPITAKPPVPFKILFI